MKGKVTGFTLLELMIAVVILSILVTLAVPSFRQMIANNRASSQANQLLQLVTLARSEAVRRNRSVTLCRATVVTTCAGTGNWADGVVLFADANGNGQIDVATDEVIRSLLPYAPGTTVTGNTNVTARITFNPQGLSTNNGTFTIVPAGSTTSTQYRYLVLGPTGRPSIRETP